MDKSFWEATPIRTDLGRVKSEIAPDSAAIVTVGVTVMEEQKSLFPPNLVVEHSHYDHGQSQEDEPTGDEETARCQEIQTGMDRIACPSINPIVHQGSRRNAVYPESPRVTKGPQGQSVDRQTRKGRRATDGFEWHRIGHLLPQRLRSHQDWYGHRICYYLDDPKQEAESEKQIGKNSTQ